MFLTLDESEAHHQKIFGGVLIPTENLIALEHEFIKLRVMHKVFGEIKWSNIDKHYLEKYKEFLDLFFNDVKATFHSTCYRDVKLKYKSAYVLIRTISWKIQNSKLGKSAICILFDNDGGRGHEESRIINDLAKSDHRFKIKILFCGQGKSHVMGTLQIADLLTGAVACTVNNIAPNAEQKAVIAYIQNNNGGIPLGWSSERFPKLHEYKMHYFDPGPIKITRS